MTQTDRDQTQSALLASGYIDLDQAGDFGEYVARLDQLRAVPAWQALKQDSYRLLRLRPGDHALDVGCGTGEDVQAMAKLVLPAGRAVGVDRSTAIIAEARRRAARAYLPVDLEVGDARHLEFPSAAFAACRAERVLQHIDDPQQVLAEMTRVVRSGGRVVVAEPDYGTLVVEGAQVEVTRRILIHRKGHFRSPTIGRQLPGLFAQVGLAEVSVLLVTIASTELGHQQEQRVIRKYAEHAAADAVISAQEAATWLGDLRAAGRDGCYRHAATVFLVSGSKI
jgi:SAM-dependent methyltransferase